MVRTRCLADARLQLHTQKVQHHLDAQKIKGVVKAPCGLFGTEQGFRLLQLAGNDDVLMFSERLPWTADTPEQRLRIALVLATWMLRSLKAVSEAPLPRFAIWWPCRFVNPTRLVIANNLVIPLIQGQIGVRSIRLPVDVRVPLGEFMRSSNTVMGSVLGSAVMMKRDVGGDQLDREADAYARLLSLQGTVVPHFLGIVLVLIVSSHTHRWSGLFKSDSFRFILTLCIRGQSLSSFANLNLSQRCVAPSILSAR